LDYVAALSESAKANCWSLAESAGHESWGRMQALLGSYRWDWKDLRAELGALATAWIPDPGGDLIGAGMAIDETAQLKHGDATACVAPQHAGCTGKVENCVTTVFCAYVTAAGQAWVDFDVYCDTRSHVVSELVKEVRRYVEGVATGLCSTRPYRDVRGRFLIGRVRSSRESPRAVDPTVAVTGEGKGRYRATIRELLLMPRYEDIPGWVVGAGC
jgi:hypothetical protein